jgi:hypothetical protein
VVHNAVEFPVELPGNYRFGTIKPEGLVHHQRQDALSGKA